MNCMFGVVKRCGRTTNIDVRLKIYNSFIASRFHYCLLGWGHLPKTSAEALEHCLLRMLRYVLCDYSAHFSRSIYSKLGLSNFHYALAMQCFLGIFCLQTKSRLFTITIFAWVNKHDFLKGHSTESTLIDLTTKLFIERHYKNFRFLASLVIPAPLTKLIPNCS